MWLVNLLLIILGVIGMFYLNGLIIKYREKVKRNVVDKIRKHFEAFEIVEIKEEKFVGDTPFNPWSSKPTFSLNGTGEYQFYFKVEILSGNEKVIKWVDATYFFGFEISFEIM